MSSLENFGHRNNPTGGVVAFLIVLGLLGSLLGSPAPAAKAASDATPAVATPAPGDFVQERLFGEVQGQLDVFGRVPLGWFAFEPGAESPDAFLTGPFEASIVSGTFEVRIGSTEATLGPDDRIDAAEGMSVTARNVGTTPGFLLALSPVSRQEWGVPPNDPLPAGFSFGLVFPTQSVRDRLMPVRLSLDRVTLGPGTTLDLVDLGGQTPMHRVQISAVSGVVAATKSEGSVPGGETLLELGGEEWFRPGDDARLRSVGPEAAQLLVLRVGEDVEP